MSDSVFVSESDIVISVCLNVFLLLQFLGSIAEFVIPSLTELADKRFFQKFIYRNVRLLTFQHGNLTYIPPMIVKGLIRSVITHSDGIKVARYRLVKIHSTLAISLLDGAVACSFIVVAGKNAILAVYDRCNQIAFLININNPLLVDNSLRSSREVVPYLGKHLFEFLNLFLLYGGTSIALDATFAMTSRNVAAELLSQTIKRYNNIINLNHIMNLECFLLYYNLLVECVFDGISVIERLADKILVLINSNLAVDPLRAVLRKLHCVRF